MAVYFGADHVVWASQAGLYTNKQAIERCASRAPHPGLVALLELLRRGGAPPASATLSHMQVRRSRYS